MSRLVGQVLKNRYEVESMVGGGGMALVYRVHDRQRHATLAMKALQADLADDPSALKRFKREANALKNLEHPQIVRFYGVFEAHHTVYLLEAFVDGPTLKDVLKQQGGRPLPIPEALAYLKALCAALGYAHRFGVVHCDVKPGNTMIDASGAIYLTDFGIARHADSSTTTMGHAGTPAYMAPEQIRSEAVSAQTDIYALGVLLYELLTGRRPFTGTTESGTGSGATADERIRDAHLNASPPDPGQFNRVLPPALAEVMLCALSKQPEERFPSTAAFFEAACQAAGLTPAQVPDRISLPAASARGSTSIGSYARPSQTSSPRPIVLQPWMVITGVVGIVALLAISLAVIALGGRAGTSVANIDPTQTPQPARDDDLQPPPADPTDEPQVLVVTATRLPNPTDLPTERPTNTVRPGPRITNLRFCNVECDSPGATFLMVFPQGITDIYVAWDYEGMERGMNYTRRWTNEGNEWAHYECVWQGPERGTWNLRLYDHTGYLRSGTWTLTITVEGETLVTGSLEVEGHSDYWNPAGRAPCPDW